MVPADRRDWNVSLGNSIENDYHSLNNRISPAYLARMTKTLSFAALHLVIAVTVGYAISGSFAFAGAMALIEPLANTVAHYFFDKWWSRREAARAERPDDAPGPLAASAT